MKSAFSLLSTYSSWNMKEGGLGEGGGQIDPPPPPEKATFKEPGYIRLKLDMKPQTNAKTLDGMKMNVKKKFKNVSPTGVASKKCHH